MVMFETLLLIAICVKDRHCHGKFTTPGLNQFFCYNYKIGATFFLGLPHLCSTKNRKFINAYSGKSVNYTYMPTRMIEETFFLSCYMCGCSKFGAKIFVALKFELPKTQVVQ